MKKALAVVSSHYVGIDLSVVSEGYVLPDDEAEAQDELHKLGDAADAWGMPWPPSSTLRWSFPLSACSDLGKQGNKAL